MGDDGPNKVGKFVILRELQVNAGDVFVTGSFVTQKMNSEFNPFNLEGHYFSMDCIEECQGI